MGDYLIWYGRNRAKTTVKTLYERQDVQAGSLAAGWLITAAGEYRGVTSDEESGTAQLPQGARLYNPDNLQSQGGSSSPQPFEHEGKLYEPGPNNHWKPNYPVGLTRLSKAGRVHVATNSIRYRRYSDDFPLKARGNLWTDTLTGSFTDTKLFAVMTNPKVIERCILMTTKPGDLVVDPTCGSGTTALVAEQWGRRWITVDTSRVALAITRQRLLTAKFEHYVIRDESKGIIGGFVCKTVPHVMLRSIAQNAALDPIFAKHDPLTDARLSDLNLALAKVGSEHRQLLAGKLLAKQRASGKRAITEADRRRWNLPAPTNGFQHWTVPFDTDPDHPDDLAQAITAYRAAWRAKQDEVDNAIAAAAEQEELVDQPEKMPSITRVSGPFTVEAVQPAETSLDEATHASPIDGAPETLENTFTAEAADAAAADPQNAEAYLDQMLRLLRMDGVRFLDNKEMRFSRLEPLGARSQAIHAEGRWALKGDADPDPEGRATVAVAFGPQYGPVTAKQVEQLIRASSRRGYDELVIAGFAFDGAAQAAIEEAEHPELRVHMANIRPDVNPGMAGLLKDTPAAQLFTVFGKPRSRLERVEGDEWRVVMEGVDIYDPVSNTVTPSRADKVAAWFIDSDYDGRSFCITQAFFPDKDAWSKLAKALDDVLDEAAFAALSGTISLPFTKGEHACVAVKVIDPRGNEVMRLHRLEG